MQNPWFRDGLDPRGRGGSGAASNLIEALEEAGLRQGELRPVEDQDAGGLIRFADAAAPRSKRFAEKPGDPASRGSRCAGRCGSLRTHVRPQTAREPQAPWAARGSPSRTRWTRRARYVPPCASGRVRLPERVASGKLALLHKQGSSRAWAEMEARRSRRTREPDQGNACEGSAMRTSDRRTPNRIVARRPATLHAVFAGRSHG